MNLSTEDQKIVVPYLIFQNQRFPVPPGFSELLEKTWVHESELKEEFEKERAVLEKYSRHVEQVNGKWRTVFTRKKVIPNENPTKTMVNASAGNES